MKTLLLIAAIVACAPRRAVPPPSAGEPDTAFVLIAPRVIMPTPLHLAILEMLYACAGPTHAQFQIAVADTILALPSGRLSYGLAGQTDIGVLAIVEAAYVHHATVVSHELLHAGWGEPDGSDVVARCTMDAGVALPERRVTCPYSYVDRGRILKVTR